MGGMSRRHWKNTLDSQKYLAYSGQGINAYNMYLVVRMLEFMLLSKCKLVPVSDGMK